MASLEDISKKLPLFTLEERVLFPGSSITITIPPANSKNLELVKSRFLATNTECSSDSMFVGVMPVPKGQSINADNQPLIGTIAYVERVTSQGWPNPTFSVHLSGTARVLVRKLVMEDPYPVGLFEKTADPKQDVLENEAEFMRLIGELRECMVQILAMAIEHGYGSQLVSKLSGFMTSQPLQQVPDLCMTFVTASFDEKLQVLASFDVIERIKLVLPLIARQKQAFEAFQKVNRNTLTIRVPFNRNTKNLYEKLGLPLRPVAKIPDGLMTDIEDQDSLQELFNKLKAAKLPPYAWKVALKDLQRIKKIAPTSPELNIIRNYLELMSELPWSKASQETLGIDKAREDLEADHYAMDKLKKRVLEYLAVRQLKNNLRGPILCFVGPPGVGKTSIGRSIAHTLGREFHRLSLGGICNQSDIRGHRRTYIGAMPGRIIQGLKTVGVNNPVFLLDEVDKLLPGVQGDPAAALLEVLDPEQNHTFHDHYLNVPFDLSQVMFVATANSVRSIPAALLDRMEVIQVDGYTPDEKLHIAVRHLVPKQVELHGLSSEDVELQADAINVLVSEYTHEAGVRNLERNLGAICRDIAVKVAENKAKNVKRAPYIVDAKMLEEILGPARYSNAELWGRLGTPGVALGLAATAAGGSVLLVEASRMEGEGKLVLTGKLGSVMKESAKLALSWLRSSANRYGIALDSDTLSRTDVHIHFPAGAVPKDGPSAGVTITTVLVSLFSNRPLATDVAMTGEISLKGAVLPVGAVMAKVFAAHRFGVRRVILPQNNAKDLLKLPQDIRDEMTFVLVSHVDEVIQAAFDGGFTLLENPIDIDPTVVSKL